MTNEGDEGEKSAYVYKTKELYGRKEINRRKT